MGKPYKSELNRLKETYDWALQVPIERVHDFVLSIVDLPLISVGSGGSCTNAAYATLLHQNTFGPSYSMTPLEVLSLDRLTPKTAVAFFSAGGRNADIIDSFRAAAHFEPEQLFVLCATKESKLGRLAKKYNYVTTFEYELPSGRDGFLATNSLFASAIIMTRAYGKIQPSLGKLPASLEQMMGSDLGSFATTLQIQIGALLDKQNIILLYGKWGKPAAIDLESKMIEAALTNVQMADFRNFAHGRHHWLAKHGNNTGILVLATPEEEQIARKTLDLIPSNIPQVILSTRYSNSLGTLELLIDIMYIAYYFGQARGIDPGRPGVPQFGSRLYNMQIPFTDSKRKFVCGEVALKKRALFRKLRCYQFSPSDVEKGAVAALDSFLTRLSNTRFNGIVFDYDGTLCDPTNRFKGPSEAIGEGIEKLITNGIHVGIATGRGSSVRNDLRKLLPEDCWEKVLVGYYNGSDIASLLDGAHPDKGGKLDITLSKLVSIIEDEGYNNNTKLTVRPKQVTVERTEAFEIKPQISMYQHLAQKHNLNTIKILESSHSIDIIAADVSKKNLVKTLEDRIKKNGNNPRILKIGDKGRWPGNDFELLDDEFSLSVDAVSPDLGSCWNLVPLGHKGEQATLDYIEAMHIGHSEFNLVLERLEAGKHAR